MQPLISIIVPCYNAELYIKGCLYSITVQTYRNIEVLLIDDCGTDGTSCVINNFLKEYNGDITFRIIKHKHNEGVSCARNTGIRNAKGEYLYFLDSDDTITPNCIESLLVPFGKDNTIETVVGNYKIVGPLHFDAFDMEERTYNTEEIIKAQFTNKLYGMPWNKLIKRDFIIRNNLFFVEGIIHEDLLWNYCCAISLNKLHVVLKPTYYYNVHPGSITTSNDQLLHQRHMMKVATHLIDFIFNSTSPDKKDVSKNPIVYKHIECLICGLIMDPAADKNEKEAKRRYGELRQLPKWGLYNVVKMKNVSIADKTKYIHYLLPQEFGYRYYKKRNLKHHHIQPENNHMKLTIITINYNNLDGLKRTIPSITSQTYTGYEFIVVDGGSTDGSKEYIASQARIDNWVSEPDKGIYNAMNKAVGLAHGEYCLFMNSGDTFFSAQVLEQCIDKLGHHDYLCGRSVFIKNDRATDTFIPPQTLDIEFLLTSALCHQSQFTRTEILKKIPFNENHRIVSDWEQFFEGWFTHECTFAPLDTVVSIYYLDGISSTCRKLDIKERNEVITKIIENSGEKGKSLKYTFLHHCAINKTNSDYDNENSSDYKFTHKQLKRLQYIERLKQKLNKSLSKKSPIQRDLGVIRYGIKFLFKDLFL